VCENEIVHIKITDALERFFLCCRLYRQ